jgi:hypothetical protein
MSNDHATFFGQSQPHTLPEGDGGTASTGNQNNPTAADTALTPHGWTQLHREQESERPGRESDPEFRRDLVARIEVHIQDFRDKKVAKIEALYQILRVAQEADVDESIRQAALDEYANQVDLIDSQQRNAEQRGEHAARLAGAGDGQDTSRQPDEDERPQRGHEHRLGERSDNDEAGRFLRDLRRELTKKRRRRTPTDSSGSDDGSTSGKGEGESNKKKRIYQSQLPWYTVEANAQKQEVDENRKKTREILRVFQRDITFAERDIKRSTSAPQGFPESEWRHIFRGEAVNLDVIFSNLHHVAPPKENVGRVGRTEISLGSTDPARKVQTSGDWTAAWNATIKATAYAFPH